MRAKEQLLSESQSIAHIGSWSWDLTSGTSVFQWSPETYRLYGVSPGTFTPSSQTLLSLIHADDRAAMQAWFGACLAGNEPPALEFRTILPDGSIRWVEGYGSLTEYGGRPAIQVVCVEDHVVVTAYRNRDFRGLRPRGFRGKRRTTACDRNCRIPLVACN